MTPRRLHIAALALILTMLLVGCSYVVPSNGGMTLNNDRCCIYCFQGNDMHFVIVTDGSLGSKGCGVSKTVLTNACWSGSIKPLGENQPEIAYKAGKNAIKIAGKEYRLKDGRAFVISTKSGAPSVRQISISPIDQVHMMVLGG